MFDGIYLENHSKDQTCASQDVITYNSLMSACSEASEWDLAISIFGDLLSSGLQPTLMLGGRWQSGQVKHS